MLKENKIGRKNVCSKRVSKVQISRIYYGINEALKKLRASVFCEKQN